MGILHFRAEATSHSNGFRRHCDVKIMKSKIISLYLHAIVEWVQSTHEGTSGRAAYGLGIGLVQYHSLSQKPVHVGHQYLSIVPAHIIETCKTI